MGKPAAIGTPASATRVVAWGIAIVLAASTFHALALAHIATKVAIDVLEEEDSQQTGRCIQQQIEELSGDLFFQDLRSEDRRQEAAATLLALVRRHGGFRIKVYDESGVILWSDERRLIGRTFPDNSLLYHALEGKTVSKVEKPERSEHEYERGGAEYVTETYVPIFFSSPRPRGVIEVYRNSDETARRLSHVNHVVWIGASIATLVLCATLAIVLGWSQRRTLHLHDHLRMRSDDLAREKSKLDAIVQGVGVGLCLIDRDHRILWTNQVLLKMFDTSDNVLGRYCHQVCWGREAVCDECPSARAMATGQECRAEQARPRPDGRSQHLQAVAWPVRDGSGAVIHALELVEDVTERVRLQAEVQQSAKLAAVGELAGGVAHEINNPMGVILATSTHLVSQVPAKLRESLELIASNAERVSRITKALLAFARRSEGVRTPMDLNDVVNGCLPLLQQRLGSRIRVSIELDRSLPRIVACENEIQQVVINLVNNAYDAMPDGGLLRIVTRAGGADRVALEVIDTGHGIAPGHLDRLFEPFFTTKPAGSGTGLGLAISQRIAMAHGGHILVRSSPGQGAAFVLEIPAYREDKP